VSFVFSDWFNFRFCFAVVPPLFLTRKKGHTSKSLLQTESLLFQIVSNNNTLLNGTTYFEVVSSFHKISKNV